MGAAAAAPVVVPVVPPAAVAARGAVPSAASAPCRHATHSRQQEIALPLPAGLWAGPEVCAEGPRLWPSKPDVFGE